MNVPRTLAAILAADVAGYSRLTGLDEEGTLKRLREVRRELINPAVSLHRGRIVNTTGDGMLIEFRSVVDAVRCALDVQRGMSSRNEGISTDRRIEFRVGINVGDVVVEGEDLLGDGVNVAARLEGISEPGGICLSEAAYQQVRDKVDVNFEDAGDQQLKNIARPVRTYRLRPDHSSAQAKPALPLPDKPSIAVLPFQNMSSDPEQEYFADGIVEEIITALSRFRQLFVIARNSSFTYKGRAVNVTQVGRELGVRYILEGSVRKERNHVRITGQLVDAATGAHLWADRFDSSLENIFDLQDSVTASVVGAITPKVEHAEIERAKRKPTENLDAYDYYLRGLTKLYQWTNAEANSEALRLFNRAIELDPEFALAYSMAARCYTARKANAWVRSREQDIAEAGKLARRAVELSKDDATTLCAAGFTIAYVADDLDTGIALIDQALALNPNLALAWHLSGTVRAFVGQSELAIEHVSRAMRLSPLDPGSSRSQGVTAMAHFLAGRYEEASSWAERALRDKPGYLTALRVAAASKALAGRLDEARMAMAQLSQLDPTLRVSNLKNVVTLRRPEDLSKLEEGLRKAGLPE